MYRIGCTQDTYFGKPFINIRHAVLIFNKLLVIYFPTSMQVEDQCTSRKDQKLEKTMFLF